MSGKRVWLAGVVAFLLGLGTARAQAPSAQPPSYGGGAGSGGTPAATDPGTAPSGLPANPRAPFVDFGAQGQPTSPDDPAAAQRVWPPSEWLLYPRSPGCCGPLGKHGPIDMELFIRGGVIFPLGNSPLVHSLLDGWEIEGGGRTLFYDPDLQAAWTAEISISNFYNHARMNNPQFTLTNIPVRTTVGALQQQAGQTPGSTGTTGTTGTNGTTGSTASPNSSSSSSGTSSSGSTTSGTNGSNSSSSSQSSQSSQQNTTPVTITVPSLNVTVSAFNQTFVNLAGGREWYLVGSGDCSYCGWSWRAGFDVGGSYGTAKMNFDEIQHRTDTVGGIFGAVHTDLEVPYHCAILFGGVRGQYNYIWTDILQATRGDYHSINVLLTLGARF
jgi:hypothetical protein